jgi:hypothetical protein
MEGIDDDDEDDDEEDDDDDIAEEEGEEEEDDEEDGDDDEEFDEDDDDDDDDSDGNVNKDMSSFWSSSPTGKIPEKFKNMPDLAMFKPQNPDLASIPEDAIATEEDARSLRKAHRRADRIIEYANDISLIASFHHKKKNYHLVRLLEVGFVILFFYLCVCVYVLLVFPYCLT